MSGPLRTVTLGNGLIVSFIDMTRHYYGGFFHVVVMAECTIELRPEYCASDTDYREALSLMGDKVRYSQTLERMGVRGDEVDSVRKILIERFIESGSVYLAASDFPSRLVISEMRKLKDRKKTTKFGFSVR